MLPSNPPFVFHVPILRKQLVAHAHIRSQAPPLTRRTSSAKISCIHSETSCTNASVAMVPNQQAWLNTSIPFPTTSAKRPSPSVIGGFLAANNARHAVRCRRIRCLLPRAQALRLRPLQLARRRVHLLQLQPLRRVVLGPPNRWLGLHSWGCWVLSSCERNRGTQWTESDHSIHLRHFTK